MSTEKNILRIRANILLQLHAVHPIGFTAMDLKTGLALDGIIVDLTLVNSQLSALTEAGFVTLKADAMNGAVKRYARTEAGRVYLSESNLIS